jgi:hypothetical protein
MEKSMKLKHIFLVLLLSASAAVQAQTSTTASAMPAERPVYRNRIYFSPFHMFASTFQLGYERDGLKGNDFMINIRGIYTKNSTEEQSGFGAEVFYKLMAYERNTENNRLKFYFSPFAQVLYLDEKISYGVVQDFSTTYFLSNREIVTMAGGGVLFGMKLISWQRFGVDFYMGGGFKYPVRGGNDIYEYSVASERHTGVFPKAGMQIGFSF